MKTEYKRDLQNNYLILEAPDEEGEAHYGLRMAEQNQVKGLLPVHESRRDGKLYLHYEITSKQTLESAYEKKTMGYQDILYVLTGIRDTLENMRKYLLSPQQLLFAPELIYVQPERKNLLLCYYAGEGECPIRMLAEFILKRLDHRDRQAVALGYGFFERASGENFSLAETLKEILTTFDAVGASGDAAPPTGAGAAGNAVPVTGAGAAGNAVPVTGAGASGNAVPVTAAGVEADKAVDKTERQEENYFEYSMHEEPYVIHRERHRKENGKNGMRRGVGDGTTVHLTDRIFAKVHPAILLSFLALTVVLEILIISGVLSLTEGGGCFFLILSVELLLNRRLLHPKSFEPEMWDEEEEEEEYQKILDEVCQGGKMAMDPEPIEETRCLIPKEKSDAFCLVCCSGDGEETFAEIRPGKEPAYIGKIRGDADILLNVSTVSRMHARIQVRQDQCFLKDMNSKNGTFVNGRRLEPQEECEIQENDVVAFAQIEYQVVKRNAVY